MAGTKPLKVIKTQEKIKFNPNGQYEWKEDDQFYISGKELEIFHNTLATLYSTGIPEPQLYVTLHAMLQITSGILIRNVESGKIKEKVSP